MKPEEKDKVLRIAKPLIPPEKLDEFARKLDELEEDDELSIVELVDRIAELIARFAVDELLSIRDPELRKLTLTVVKASAKFLIGPKITEVFLRSTVRRVENWS